MGLALWAVFTNVNARFLLPHLWREPNVLVFSIFFGFHHRFFCWNSCRRTTFTTICLGNTNTHRKFLHSIIEQYTTCSRLSNNTHG